MPLYEYQCPKCGRFELIRQFSDAPLTACPTCGSKVQKLASAPAFHLKGTGWYATDYAKKSGTSTPGEGKSGESKAGDAKVGDKSDSKSGDSGKGTVGESSKSSKDAAPAAAASTSKKTS